MNDQGVKVLGFTIAGLALIGLSRFAPTVAVGLAVTILAGVVLSKTGEITALVDRVTAAYGSTVGDIGSTTGTNPHSLQA